MDGHTHTEADSFSHGKLYLFIRRVVRNHASFLIRPWTVFKRVIWVLRYPTAASRFAKIYETNYWANGESRSGEGSTLEATRDVRLALERFIIEHGVDSILDVPCGDFNWMQYTEIRVHYYGGDIVEELISCNQAQHGTASRSFAVIDLTRTQLPNCSLVFSRDCLNHLSISDIRLAIANIRRSGAEYLAVTQFPGQRVNKDQESGFNYRELNFRLPPFAWPNPSAIFAESSHPGKHIAFWKIATLPD
jgi:hypothetical protein